MLNPGIDIPALPNLPIAAAFTPPVSMFTTSLGAGSVDSPRGGSRGGIGGGRFALAPPSSPDVPSRLGGNGRVSVLKPVVFVV